MKPEWETDYEQLCHQGSVPTEGFFKMRFKPRGPWIPARIYRAIPLDPETGEILDRSWLLTGEINGRESDFRHVWVWGHSIDEREYKWLTAMTAIQTM